MGAGCTVTPRTRHCRRPRPHGSARSVAFLHGDNGLRRVPRAAARAVKMTDVTAETRKVEEEWRQAAGTARPRN